MRVIPQLSTLASIQFPAVGGRETRTLINRLNGGDSVVYPDAKAGRKTWRLAYKGLTEEERQTLESFFLGVEGRLRPFTFLDPLQNLFARSGEFTAPEWTKEAPLSVTGGHADPSGGVLAHGLANSSGAPRRMYQSLNVPAWFHYSLSIYARAETPAQIQLVLKGGSNVASQSFPLTGNWARYTLAATAGGSSESVEAGVELGSGAEMYVFGAQLEAQPAASEYKATGAEGGVYPNARLMQDELSWITSAPGAHNTTLTIVSR